MKFSKSWLVCMNFSFNCQWHFFFFMTDADTRKKWATSWENLFMSYANNKGAEQPAHLRSLISPFVVCCLDSLISLISISEISSLHLASVAEQTGLSLTRSKTPKTDFLVTRLKWLLEHNAHAIFPPARYRSCPINHGSCVRQPQRRKTRHFVNITNPFFFKLYDYIWHCPKTFVRIAHFHGLNI